MTLILGAAEAEAISRAKIINPMKDLAEDMEHALSLGEKKVIQRTAGRGLIVKKRSQEFGSADDHDIADGKGHPYV
jgi:hypothetical protein